MSLWLKSVLPQHKAVARQAAAYGTTEHAVVAILALMDKNISAILLHALSVQNSLQTPARRYALHTTFQIQVICAFFALILILTVLLVTVATVSVVQMGLQQMQIIQPSASLVYAALGIAHFAKII